MPYGNENKSDFSLLILLSAIFFAIMSLLLLIELVGTKSRMLELEKKLAALRSENLIRKEIPGKDSTSKKRSSNSELKRLEKEVAYWKNKFKEQEGKRNATFTCFGGKDEFLRFLYLSDDAARRQMMNKLGLMPTNAEFSSLYETFFPNYDSKLFQARYLMKDWFYTDRDAFCRYVLSLPQGRPYNDGLTFIIQEWQRDNPQGLDIILRFAQERRPYDPAIMDAIYKYAWNYPEIATKWFELLQEQTQKNHVVPLLTRYYAEKNPESAYAWLKSLMPTELRDVALESFISGLKTKDPMELLSYVQEISSENPRYNALAFIAARAVVDHPEVTRSILAKFDRGSRRDECLRGIVMSLSSTSPIDAIEWTNEIENEIVRNQCLSMICYTWMSGNDSASFEIWFSSAQLPENLRTDLQRTYDSIKNREK